MQTRPAYNPGTGKNTIDMRHYLHGGELRMTDAIAAELSRQHEIIEREFERNRRTVVDELLRKGWLPVPGSRRNGNCYPHTAPIRTERLMVSPDERLILVHVDETVHNSGEITMWTEEIAR